jgi:hypothetical protein
VANPPVINGKQVSLLLTLLLQNGQTSTRSQLEWLEFEAQIKVNKLEEVPNDRRFQAAINTLKTLAEWTL